MLNFLAIFVVFWLGWACARYQTGYCIILGFSFSLRAVRPVVSGVNQSRGVDIFFNEDGKVSDKKNFRGRMRFCRTVIAPAKICKSSRKEKATVTFFFVFETTTATINFSRKEKKIIREIFGKYSGSIWEVYNLTVLAEAVSQAMYGFYEVFGSICGF